LSGRLFHLIFLVLVLVGGCVDRMMTITSDPDGAIIYLNDQEIGRTPFTHDFEQYGNYELEVRKEGYQTVKRTQAIEEPWWQLVPLDLATALLPFRFTDTRAYHYTMVPASTQAADAQMMLGHAGELRSMLLTSPNTRLPTSFPTSQPAAHSRR
jgi:hypothetical protein